MTERKSALTLAAGTYGGGMSVLWRSESGDWVLGCGDAAAAANASFGVYSARHGLQYLVDENAGTVGVHCRREGHWERVTAISIEGAAPCHIALNPTETLLAVANYASGSISLVRLNEQGLPHGQVQVHANRGSGPNAQRQDAPHAHWVGFSADGRLLYQTDLGTDEILAFAIDDQDNLSAPHRAYRAPPGSGPRHLLFHPQLAGKAYLASELANTLTLLDCAAGTFGNPRILSTLPSDWQGESIVAHIAMNRAATRLYVSNRGHDSIAVFSIDDDGVPTLLQHAPAGGAFPRFFLLLEDEALMLVANEKGQTVSTLTIESDGCLSPTGASLSIPGVCYLLNPDPKVVRC